MLNVDPVAVFPRASTMEGAGAVLAPTLKLLSGVQVTAPPVTGVGKQVQPVMVTVDPFSAARITAGVRSLVSYGTDVSPSTDVTVGALGAATSLVREPVSETDGYRAPSSVMVATMLMLVPSPMDEASTLKVNAPLLHVGVAGVDVTPAPSMVTLTVSLSCEQVPATGYEAALLTLITPGVVRVIASGF